MDVSAKITGIRYRPYLCRSLKEYSFQEIENAFDNDSTFILNIGRKKQIALSWWVSPKRTRSYPYARVYDSLGFQGKKVTIIPVMKDEGKGGDRDFLQWDTLSLMSLLGIYVIICYYISAEKSSRQKNKITNQKFDFKYLRKELKSLLSYQSDALHWNLEQIEKVGEIAKKALFFYDSISKSLGVEMHSKPLAEKRIDELIKGKEIFMRLSRELAKRAQDREIATLQPKEKLEGIKAKLTILNYLGGYYFFTCDEVEIKGKNIYLIEGKHSRQSMIPSLEDIKDGLLKMILFTNLKEVKIGRKEYKPISILKLTSNIQFQKEKLNSSQIDTLKLLRKEAEENNFRIKLNDTDIIEIIS